MLEELRELSEAKKKQVLIIATIIIMIIIVGAWAVYFNSIIQGTAQQEVAQTTASAPAATTSTAPAAVVSMAAPAAPAASGPSLWQNIKNSFGSIVTIFNRPSQYTIHPQ